MLIPMGTEQLELGSCYLTELRDANALLDQPELLRAQMAEDGYLLIRGMHDRDAVLEARRQILEAAARDGNAIAPGSDLMQGVINPGATWPRMMGKREITHAPAVRQVLEGEPIFDFFNRYFGEATRTFDYKWLRGVQTEGFTGAHYDFVYMGRGSERLHTCWVPLGDLPLEMGTLAILVGSHNLQSFAKVRDTYGRMDVDRDRVQGWFDNNPKAVVDRFGGQWATTQFSAGDVIIFGMHTMHASTNNQTNQWRVSCDTRFQPAADPVDERWVGENPIAHYAWNSEPDKLKPMTSARKQWGV